MVVGAKASSCVREVKIKNWKIKNWNIFGGSKLNDYERYPSKERTAPPDLLPPQRLQALGRFQFWRKVERETKSSKGPIYLVKIWFDWVLFKINLNLFKIMRKIPGCSMSLSSTSETSERVGHGPTSLTSTAGWRRSGTALPKSRRRRCRGGCSSADFFIKLKVETDCH